MRYHIILMMALVVSVGSMVLVQQNATNQTGNQTSNSSTYLQPASAAPDNTKFCDVFNNDDGTQGRDCTHKSMGECKKSDRASGMDFAGCEKREQGGNNGDGEPEEPDGGNNLSPDEDGEGGGSGPND